jgi:chemotaxis protein MotD
MMDALSAPPAPTPGPALQHGGSGSGAGADQSEGGSFSKVLSNSGNHEKDGRLREDGNEGTTEQADAPDHPKTTQAKRPVIDISSAKIATEDEVPAQVADMSTDDLARLLADARSKTKGMKPEKESAPNTEVGAETSTKAELAKPLGGLREKKTVADDQTATPAVGEEETATGEQKGVDLTDVLRLLAGTAPDEVKVGDEAGDTEQTAEPVVDRKTHSMLSEALAASTGTAADSSTNSDDQGASPDRSFRVVRADGKGEPMILQNDATAGADDTGEAAEVETITVLDARRFIAPASTTNGASITAAMLGDTEWVSAMSPGSELANAATHSSQGKVVNTLKLQMSPIELGSVTATLRLSGEELSVQLTVDNPAALRQLSNDSSEILKSLRAQGLTVDHVQVNMQVSSADRSADAGQNNLASQQQGQQTFQSGGQASDGRARGESADNNARTSDERVVQQADIPAGDPRGTRPDQLYV